MNQRIRLLPTAAALLTIFVSVDAAADCNPNTLETRADSAYEQSGQGNKACSDFLGQPDPNNPTVSVPMTTLYEGDAFPTVQVPGVNVIFNGTSIDWSIDQSVADPQTGKPRSADIVIVEAADGKSCNYQYGGDVAAGTNLTAAGSKPAKSVVICSDGISTGTLVQSETPAPIATDSVLGCTSDTGADLQAALDNDDDIVVAVGFGDNEKGAVVAVCADKHPVDGATRSLVRCDGTCVGPEKFVTEEMAADPNFVDDGTYVGPNSIQCQQDIAANPTLLAEGRLPLSCRSCELGPPTTQPNTDEFCWQKTHKVLPNHPLGVGSFLPPVERETQHVVLKRYQGSVCYLTTVNYYGIDYSYYVCYPENF